MLAFTYKHIYIHTQMVETMNNYVTESVMAAKTYSTVWQICFKFDLFLMKSKIKFKTCIYYHKYGWGMIAAKASKTKRGMDESTKVDSCM